MIVNSQSNNSLVAGISESYNNLATTTFTSGTIHHEMRIMNKDGTYGGILIVSNETARNNANRQRITTMYNGKAYHPQYIQLLGRDTCCNVGLQGSCRSAGDVYASNAYFVSYTGLTLGGSDFTIECIGTLLTGSDMALEWLHALYCWIKGESFSLGAAELIGFESDPTQLQKIDIYYGGGVGKNIYVDVTNSQTAEHHFAVTYSHSAGKLYFFVDGTLKSTQTKTLTAKTRCFSLNFRHGECKYFRISKTARYTAAFTKPTSLSKDSNTLVFLQYPLTVETGKKTIGYPVEHASFSSTTTQTVISDFNTSGSINFQPIRYDLETPYNTSNTSTSYGSIYSAGYQFIKIHNVPLGYTDFTIEFWIKPDSGNVTSGTNSARVLTVVNHEAYDDNNFGASIMFNGWKISSSASTVKNWTSTNQTTINGTTAISAGTWYHIAFVYQKSSSKQSLYVNGVLQGSRTCAIPLGKYRLSCMGDNVGRFQGKLSDLVISSTARWTAAFTKPTATPTTSTTIGNLGRYFYNAT